MWLEAIITREDFHEALKQFLPVTIPLDKEDKQRALWLGEATEVSIVEKRGVRVTCPASITWTIAGVAAKVSLATLSVLIEPRFRDKNQGQSIVFELSLEEADIVGLPALIDTTIMKAVNAALASKDLEWHFTRALTQVVPLKDLFEPIDALTVDVLWGKERVGTDAVVLAVSFRLGFKRTD